jgi:hypothetical protein
MPLSTSFCTRYVRSCLFDWFLDSVSVFWTHPAALETVRSVGNTRFTYTSRGTMSDWEDEEAWNVGATGGGGGSDSDEDETALELAREQEEKERLEREGPAKMSFEEIMKQRSKSLLESNAADTTALPAEEQVLSVAEQRAIMMKGIKAAEEADHRLTEELFGSGGEGVQKDEKKGPSLDAILEAISALDIQTSEDHEKLAALMASKVPKDNAQAVYAFVHNIFNELFTGDVCELAKPIVNEIDVQLLEKRTLKSSMKAEAEAKARDAKLKAEAEARMNAAPKGGDMLDMMDNVGDYSDEEDEDGFDFM